jgi:hypothetical protein
MIGIGICIDKDREYRIHEVRMRSMELNWDVVAMRRDTILERKGRIWVIGGTYSMAWVPVGLMTVEDNG